ncbi:hypothetical protein N644_0418 [Lactiplantibacillus paraplantarum]|nr:hypothetical protein N644_0418 [Lactiplantibacillus paraplantarum]
MAVMMATGTNDRKLINQWGTVRFLMMAKGTMRDSQVTRPQSKMVAKM